jgi:hypothetical protein
MLGKRLNYTVCIVMLYAIFFGSRPGFAQFDLTESHVMAAASTGSLDLPEYEALKGKTVRDVVAILGNPDRIESGEIYSAKFADGSYSVVLTYTERQIQVYVTSDAMVLGILKIK